MATDLLHTQRQLHRRNENYSYWRVVSSAAGWPVLTGADLEVLEVVLVFASVLVGQALAELVRVERLVLHLRVLLRHL